MQFLFLKLVKSETQCKLYEDQVLEWEKKYNDLEKDYQSLKLKMAAESEHWLTIQALFGSEKDTDETKDTPKDTEIPSETLFKEIGCNTDNIPIPAERKLSAPRSRKASKEMVDKYVSPIQSPKKMNLNEIATQTEKVNNEAQEELVKEQQEKQKPLDVSIRETKVEESRKETSEAEIQTVLDSVEKESKAIQTLQEEGQEKIDKEKTIKESELQEALDKLKQTEER